MEIEETSENNVQNEVVELEEVVSFVTMQIDEPYITDTDILLFCADYC